MESVKLNIRGKNLCDGISQSYYLNNDVNICGKVTGNSGLVIDVQDKAYVTVSTKITQARYRIACINSLLQEENDTIVAYRGVQKDNTSATVTINTTGYSYLIINATDLNSILAEDGSVATEYEPYQNQTINIDLKGKKLCAISDTIKDKLLIDRNGNVALQKNVDMYSIIGNENFEFRTSEGTGISQFDFSVNCKLIQTQAEDFSVLSNYFGTEKIWNNSWLKDNICIQMLRNKKIRFQTSKFATKDEAKDFFKQQYEAGNPVIVYFQAESKLIDLGQLTKLQKTFEGINNIWAETNLGNTEIEIEYVQDVKKLLEKQAEQQNARLDNIEALLSTTETSALLLDNMQNDLESEVK